MVVREHTFAGGFAQELAGVEPGGRDVGEAFGEGRGEGVAGDPGRELVERGCPFVGGRVVAVAELVDEVSLPADCCLALLRIARGSPVGRVDGGRCAPNFDVGDQVG